MTEPFRDRVRKVRDEQQISIFDAYKIVRRADLESILGDIAVGAADPAMTKEQLGQLVGLLARSLRTYLCDQGPRG